VSEQPIQIGDIDDDSDNQNWLRDLNAAAAQAGIDTSHDAGGQDDDSSE
jgi:hypothetical protein